MAILNVTHDTSIIPDLISASGHAPTHSGLIVALIPAYNEDRFIASVILKARHYVDRVIVVDDGSQDLTANLAEEAGAEVIRHTQNQGKAGALNTGIARIRSLDVSAVVLLDGDGQHDPASIPDLITPILMQHVDLVIGSRFIGVKSNTPHWRIFGQQALTTATNFASGVALTDSQTGFRALSAQAISKMNFRTSGFSVESEMQFLVKRHGLTVQEVPIQVNYYERPKRSPLKHGLQVLNGIILIISQNRPLFFFGLPGLFLMLIGVLLAVLVIDRYNAFEELAVGTAIISMSLITLGALTTFTGLILRTIRAYLV